MSSGHARAMNLQLNSAGPGLRTPQAARGVARHALFAGLPMRCGWLSAGTPPSPTRRRKGFTRAAPQRHLVAEHASVIAAHPELDPRCSG